jgi:hypothetical protein
MRSVYGSKFFIGWPSAFLKSSYLLERNFEEKEYMWRREIHNAYLSLSIFPSSSNDLKAAITTSSSSEPENYKTINN